MTHRQTTIDADTINGYLQTALFSIFNRAAVVSLIVPMVSFVKQLLYINSLKIYFPVRLFPLFKV